jgi:glutathione S-transferase
VDFENYPKINEWYERCRSLPGFDDNEKGAKMMSAKLTELLDEPLWN